MATNATADGITRPSLIAIIGGIYEHDDGGDKRRLVAVSSSSSSSVSRRARNFKEKHFHCHIRRLQSLLRNAIGDDKRRNRRQRIDLD